MTPLCKKKKNNSGNALFLILIAVALFAALSYAVTQSGRGGGNIDREQRALLVSQLHNQIASFQHTVQRMQLINGVSTADITGSSRQEFEGSPHPLYCDTGANCLYAPEGGGLPLVNPPSAACVEGAPCLWETSAGSIKAGAMSPDICLSYNQSLGLDEIPVLNETTGENYYATVFQVYGPACAQDLSLFGIGYIIDKDSFIATY